MGTWTFSDEEMTATTQTQLKKGRNWIDTPLPVTKLLMENRETEEGGERVIVPFNWQRHSNSTRITDGFDSVDLTGRPVLTHGYDDWCMVVSPITWSLYDERINRGRARKMDKIAERSRDTDLRMHRELELQTLQANQTPWADLNSWNGFDSSTGFLEQDAVGSQTNTAMNIAKGTYSALVGAQNQRGDIAGAFSTNGLNVTRSTLVETTFLNQETDEPAKPAGLISKNYLVNYARAIQSSDLYTRDFRDGAILDITINGEKYMLCDNLPNAGTVTGVSNQEWSLLRVDCNALYLIFQSGSEFANHPWRFLGGAQMLVKASLIEFMGQNVFKFLGTSSVVYGGDTW